MRIPASDIFKVTPAPKFEINHRRFADVSLQTVVIVFFLLVGSMLSNPGVSALVNKDDQTHYGQELARIDQSLNAKIDVSSARPESWLHLEQVAKAYIDRARLTGEYEDYVASISVLKQAFALAGERGGPVLTRASLNFTMHRLPAVEADLVAAESALLVDTPTSMAIRGLRADVSFYTAKYTQAKTSYDMLESSYPSVTSATRLAHYYAHVGKYIEAERWFEKAEQRVTGPSAHLRAWLKLQLGILDLERGRLNDALGHYQDGLDLFPGFWLLEEHVAEIEVMQGRDEIAEDKYRDLIRRTGSPVFMSALADILATRSNKGDMSEARRWLEKASNIYEARAHNSPELISGHALEHFLNMGDAERALRLAEFNYQLRPGGQAALQLVQAQVAVGQVSEASELLKSLLSSPYRSADLFATACAIYRINGDAQRADEYETLARVINPMAIDKLGDC